MAGWHATLLDANKTPIPSNRINAAPIGTVAFFVQVDPNDNLSGETFTLAVTADAFPLYGSSGLLTFTTGQAVPTPDDAITLDLVETDLGPGVTFDGATISSPAGGLSSYVILCHFVNGGNLGQEVLQTAGASGWTPTFVSGIPNPVAANTTRAMGFNVTPTASATNGILQYVIRDLDTATIVKSVSFAARLTP